MSEHNPTAGLPLFTAATEKRSRTRSRTSTAAARSSEPARMKRREQVYLAIVAAGGLARFQIAEHLGVPDHWITSSVEALLKADPPRIRECEDREVLNPRSGKRCAVLVPTQ